jgi:hypothetical protein
MLTDPQVEIGGYVGRIISSNNIWVLGPFIEQSILLLVAPALFAASIYIILGRVILLVDGERFSLIRQKYLTTLFVCGDILAFLTQAGGGGIQAMRTTTSVHLGQTIIVIGLFLQTLFFGLFIAVAVIFHRRLVSSEGQNLELNALPWRKHIFALYTGSGLIMVRSMFRVVEYLMGNDGYLLRHEVFLYIFDAVLMFSVMALFNIIHPSEITRLMRDGRSPLQRQPPFGQHELKDRAQDIEERDG